MKKELNNEAAYNEKISYRGKVNTNFMVTRYQKKVLTAFVYQ